MAKKEYEFHGKAYYAQVHRPDSRYNDYRIKFYPADADTRRAIKATGTQCNVKEDDNGFFYQFKNEIQPTVVDTQGNPVTALIGNGSDVILKIMVEDFVSTKYGEIHRTKFVGLVVTNLIPYEKKEVTATDATLPA
jgi:hypothetical protein